MRFGQRFRSEITIGALARGWEKQELIEGTVDADDKRIVPIA